MRRHLKYISYIVRHKWFVLVASIRIGAPLWAAISHDASKFLPSEWLPYARCFYAPDGAKQYKPGAEFDKAWLVHQHRNPHHWQTWILREDGGAVKALPMPSRYMLEMVADWMGAGRAITGKWEACLWYDRNKQAISLHPETRAAVEELLRTV